MLSPRIWRKRSLTASADSLVIKEDTATVPGEPTRVSAEDLAAPQQEDVVLPTAPASAASEPPSHDESGDVQSNGAAAASDGAASGPPSHDGRADAQSDGAATASAAATVEAQTLERAAVRLQAAQRGSVARSLTAPATTAPSAASSWFARMQLSSQKCLAKVSGKTARGAPEDEPEEGAGAAKAALGCVFGLAAVGWVAVLAAFP